MKLFKHSAANEIFFIDQYGDLAYIEPLSRPAEVLDTEAPNDYKTVNLETYRDDTIGRLSPLDMRTIFAALTCSGHHASVLDILNCRDCANLLDKMSK